MNIKAAATILFFISIAVLSGCGEDKKKLSIEEETETLIEQIKVEEKDCSFIGTVANIEYLSAYEGEVFLTHFDPRFVLEVDVEKVIAENCPVKVGKQAFAIHSPTLLFGGCDIPESESIMRPELKGMKFGFMLKKSDDSRVFWLTVRDLK